MGVNVEVPGLDLVLPEILDGTVLLLEGGLAPAKNHLARQLAKSAAKAGRRVTMLSSRPEDGFLPADRVQVREEEAWPEGNGAGADLVADSFSLLCLGESATRVASRLRSIKADAVRGGTVAILVVDDGQLDAAAQSACHHLADAVVQFRTREDADGPMPYLRVAKAPGNKGLNRNVFYTLDGHHFLIDTRRRVN